MKLRLHSLELTFKKQRETITFADFTYFYGQMGAGKSSIARLVDYCFGADLGEEGMTPALQQEFIAAELTIELEETVVSLERNAGENKIHASWQKGEESFEILVPARTPSGEVLSGTGVENLSDLIFYIAGVTPPRVRRSKASEDSELQRLTLRNLLWYCYLDQDSMDSSFFHLDRLADQFKRLASRDVMRYMVGFHQERVAQLEAEIERLRSLRQRNESGAQAMQDALDSAEIGDASQVLERKQALEAELIKVQEDLVRVRAESQQLRTHAAQALQVKGRVMADQLAELYRALLELSETLRKDREHRNELNALASRFLRTQSARQLLSGVDFKGCPKCGQTLPIRSDDVCSVCGQVHSDTTSGVLTDAALRDDLDARKTDLDDVIDRQERQLKLIERQIVEVVNAKEEVDVQLNAASKEYDSAYLSSALDREKRKASLIQELRDLVKLEALAHKINELAEESAKLLAKENGLKEVLRKARDQAEKDTQNIKKLKGYFLDCLWRAKLASFRKDDVVEMSSTNFFPEIHPKDEGDATVISYTNLGSGGLKTLYKCCFAVAVHRLAHEVGSILPSFLIIDSPMKSVSERENREQFLGFFDMLFELSETELVGTQFIVIDKELCEPKKDYTRTFASRHMKPNDGIKPEDNPDPPLIPYYAR